MDITLPPDFKEFLRLLNTHGVEYLLIGGYAVGYYGYPRATNSGCLLLLPLRYQARQRGLHAGDLSHCQTQGRAGPRRIPHQARDPRHLRRDAADHGDGHAVSHASRPTACTRLDTAGNHAGGGNGTTE